MFKRFIDKQLSIIFGRTEASICAYLEAHIGRKVALVLTENSTSMLSARVRDGVMHVRLHRMFINANSNVMNEIALYLKNRKGDMTSFRQFIRDNRERLHKKPPKTVAVKTAGRFHDLRELFDEVNREYFDGMIESVITWGASSSRYAVRKRTLGSYSGGSKIIRINPVLDKKSVPRYFITFVVYHEMLHEAVGISRQGDRRICHSREFRKREKFFKDYERAMAWERRSS
jgi:predicted metal-dependent hydrolase